MSKRRGNGEGTIFYRQDRKLWGGRISVGYDQDGKRKRRTIYGKTKKEVQDKLARLRTRQLDGTLSDESKLTVGQYLDHWLEAAVRPHRRDGTHDSYESRIRCHIKPRIGGVKLSKLNPAQVQGLYSALEADGASGVTRELVHVILRKALDQAVRWQMIPRNACDAVERPRRGRTDINPFSREQTQTLLHTARGTRLEALYVLAVTTGMRQGELLGLQWQDIDLDEASLSVRRAVGTRRGRVVVKPLKTPSSRRRIDLPRMAVEALLEHRKRMMAEGMAGSDWVFPNHVGKPISKDNLVRRSYRPLLKAAGLPQRRFHDLRHTAATLMLLDGVHPKIVQERLGHASIRITLDTYSHVLPSMQREAADRLDALLGTG